MPSWSGDPLNKGTPVRLIPKDPGFGFTGFKASDLCAFIGLGLNRVYRFRAYNYRGLGCRG